MTDILIKVAAVAALLVALFFAEQYIEGLGYDRAKAEDRAAIEQSKREAANALLREVDKTHAAEQALQAFKNQQELKDADHQKTVADLSSRLRTLAGPAGRLRDPQAFGCGAGGSGSPGAVAPAPGVGADGGAQAGGLLSKPLTELLFRLTREADDINNAYASCRADAYTVRAKP
jgi:hypothetical protein